MKIARKIRKIPIISGDRTPFFLLSFREDTSNFSLLFFLIIRIIAYLYCFTKCRVDSSKPPFYLGDQKCMFDKSNTYIDNLKVCLINQTPTEEILFVVGA